MTTKEEVITAIEATEARVERLTPALLARADARLADSEWDVRQALCHVAARSNAVPLATNLAGRVLAAQARGQAPDWVGSARPGEINQGQIDERRERSVPDLLHEIHAGHQAAIQAVRELAAEMFEQRFPRFSGEGEISLGELILRAGSGHENDHMDRIEQALGAGATAA